MLRQYELVERVLSYDPHANEEALNRAYVFAMKMHGSQKRASGDPYFSHPIEVAGILTEYKLDTASIITALLHDTIEDTVATYEDISRLFGEEVAKLVDGVTRLTQLQNKANMALDAKKAGQAEDLRKFLLAMSQDIRVLLVKLADRLHNMRTLQFKKPESRKRTAVETIEIYAPLAERIGMQGMKTELENIAFAELNPEAVQTISNRLAFLRQQEDNPVRAIIEKLREDLKEAELEADISGREKTPYSIWRKMQQNNMTFEQLADIIAFRVIVDTVGDCYQALGVFHTKYQMIPGRYKDYISVPKGNGYQSLHTGVIGPLNQRIEIQIRTREMHEVAENGVAAHWEYKQGARIDTSQFRWIRELVDILESDVDPEEFLENTKMAMYHDQVFCFTPRGELISLPKDATAVDFAYAIHAGLGNRTVGVKINGHLKPLRTILANGDQVEVITSKTPNPSPEWERFVVTGKARSAIRRFIREQKKTQYLDLGKQIIARAFRAQEKSFDEAALTKVLPNFKVGSLEDLYVRVGEGFHTGVEVLRSAFPEKDSAFTKVLRSLTPSKTAAKKKTKAADDDSPIQGLIPGVVLHFAKCCHPLPGDNIVGIITTGKGVTVHAVNCPTLQRFADEPERWIDVTWKNRTVLEGQPLEGRISLIAKAGADTLGILTTILAKHEANLNQLHISNRLAGQVEMSLDIEVKSTEHLETVMAALRSSPLVSSIRRLVG